MSYSVLADALEPVLPEILWRKDWPDLQEKFGLPLARGTMANLDSMGQGPVSGFAGGRRFYLKPNYLSWLRSLDK